MKHDWDYSDYGKQPTDMQIHNRRICRNCGKEQKKFSNQVWGRVVGYAWEPLVGRCKNEIKTQKTL